MKVKDKIKNIVHPISKDEQNKLLWWLKRNKNKLVSIIAGSNSSESSSSGTSGTNGTSGGTSKSFLRVSQVDSQDNSLVFIEGSKEEILEKLNTFDAFDVEYIHSSLYEGYGEVIRTSCLCTVTKNIEDYGTIKTIYIWVPSQVYNSGNLQPNLVGSLWIKIGMFKPLGSSNYVIQAIGDENPTRIAENIPVSVGDETYTGIVIGHVGDQGDDYPDGR